MNGRADDGAGAGRGAPDTRRWWWWIPVAAIALIVAFLLLRGGGEAEEGGPQGVPETPSIEPAEPGQTGTGSITIGGEPADALLDAGNVGGHAGEEVIGTLVRVDSVIAEGVYWVGEERAQLLLVEPEGLDRQFSQGDEVTFRGTLRELDDEARSAVWGAEMEPTVEAQGVYVAVDELAGATP